MPSVGTYSQLATQKKKVTATPTVHERFGPDSFQHTEKNDKKENSSSMRYEMSKWNFGDAVLVMTD